jgi:16S rRNA (guanine527-N7)-methyltransferase
MPPDTRSDEIARLQTAADALGLTLAADVASRLVDVLDLLLRWNRVYNLTALRDRATALDHHLVDCLAAVPALDRWWAAHPDQEPKLLDVGSGGGLPGLVWAVVRPGWSVVCVDAVAKKASFVRQAAAELGLGNVRSLHGRVETVALDRGGFPVVTSRAFASLADFVRWTARHRAPAGVWLAMKGRPPDDERAELPADVTVFHVEPLQVPGLDAQRCLVWLAPASSGPPADPPAPAPRAPEPVDDR